MKQWISAPLCAVICTIASAAEPERKDVSLPVSSMILNYIPAPPTQSPGNFQKEGLNIKVGNSQTSDNKALQALIVGSADAVVGSYDHTIHVQMQGEDAVSVALLSVMSGIVPVVRPDLSIENGKDLKSKEIGITTPGSSADLFARYCTIESGLQMNDVLYIAVGSGASGMLVLSRKETGTLMSLDPVAGLLGKRRAAKFLVSTHTDAGSNAMFGGRYPTATPYAIRNFMAKNPETVQCLVNAFICTLERIDISTSGTIADRMPKEWQVGGCDVFVDVLRHSESIFLKGGLATDTDTKVALTVLSSYDKKIRNAKIELNKAYTNRSIDQALKMIK